MRVLLSLTAGLTAGCEQATRKQRPRGCAASLSVDTTDKLAARVAAALQPGTAGCLPSLEVSEDVLFSDDFSTLLRGRDAYKRASIAWSSAWLADAAVHESRWETLRVASVSSDSVVVSWSVRWIPDSTLPLVRAGRLLRWHVTFYDLLDRSHLASSFSWRKAGKLLLRAARTGELPLQESCVRGRSTLTFSSGGLLTRHEERLDLVPDFRALRVRNRRVARDTADYLAEWRRPPGVSPRAWDDSIREKLLLSQVPGMGVLDIDGQTPEQQSEQLESLAALLGLTTVAVLLFGAVAGKMRADDISQRRAWMDDDEVVGDAGARIRSRRLLSRRSSSG